MFVIYVCILIKGINYHVFLSFQMCIADFAVKNFKSLPRKKIKELVENMQVLIEGLKPSFLWDICGAHVDELKDFIADLNNALIISESFVLLIINELDYLIGRKSLLVSQIELCFSDQIMFIMSSTKLMCPVPRQMDPPIITSIIIVVILNYIQSLNRKLVKLHYYPSGVENHY